MLEPSVERSCISEVTFSAQHVRLPDALWVSRALFPGGLPEDAHRLFSERFSYAIRGNECFESFVFDDGADILLGGERYGGAGVAENGGGVRCGNHGPYQLKGVGRNPLSGLNTDQWHSYGGLSARDAIYETTITQVLDVVLPVGVAAVFGVILTTADGAYCEYSATAPPRRGWGALMVREVCLRPGHFLRAAGYTPRRDAATRISRDSLRVMQVNRKLHQQLPNTRDLMKLLGRFVSNCATQFAFAKFARICHGGLGPSNICFDGRWIDLTSSSFIGGGRNVGGWRSAPTFLEEPLILPRMLRELIDTYNKYNNLDLKPAPIIDYYNEKLEFQFQRQLGVFFGINPAVPVDFFDRPEYAALLELVLLVLNSGNIIVGKREKLSADDPAIELQSALFVSLSNPARALNRLAGLERLVRGFDAQLAVDSFKYLLTCAFDSAPRSGMLFEDFARRCAIEALRRSLFSEYFFKVRILKRIDQLLATAPFECRALVDDSLAAASWIYQTRDTDRACLFKTGGVTLSFDARTGSYVLERAAMRESYQHKGAPLASILDDLPPSTFLLHGYDFRARLDDLSQVLSDMTPGKSARWTAQ